MTTREISALDMAFLCLDRHDAPMHMGAVAVFDPPAEPDPAGLRRTLAERAGRIPRMRMRVCAQPLLPAGAEWGEDPDFRPEEHIHNHQLVWPGGLDELTALTSELMAEPLDLARPLWELHVLTGLQGGRFAVLVKLHHAMADGRGAVELGLGLLDGFGDRATAAEQPRGTGGFAGLLHTLMGGATDPVKLWHTATGVAGSVGRMTAQVRQSLDIGLSVAGNMQLPTGSSPLRAPACAGKRIELFALDVHDIRRVRQCHGGTTNDVVLAVVAGALRRWLLARGYPVESLHPRALVPISQRCRDRTADGNNKLSGYLCELPVAEADPARRFAAIRTAMRRNKSEGPLRGAGALPVLASRVPSAVHRLATRMTSGGAPMLFDTVVTNVPLPDTAACLDGASLREMYPLVPLAAGQALSIAASHYRGRVHVGLHANRAALPDIEKFNEAIPQALAELADLDG